MRFIENIILKADLRKAKAGLAEINDSIDFYQGVIDTNSEPRHRGIVDNAIDQIEKARSESLIWARQVDAIERALSNK